MRLSQPTARCFFVLDARHRLLFWTKNMGQRGQGAPALRDALRGTSGSGNPPDPFRWTLHSLWFAALTRPGCPSLRPGAPGLFVPHWRHRNGWGVPATRRRAKLCRPLPCGSPWLSRSQPLGR